MFISSPAPVINSDEKYGKSSLKSFQQNGSWIQRDAGYLTDGETYYENSSRIEPKHHHQWFMEANRSETFSNKKQAIEGVNSRVVSEISRMNVSPWHITSTFQSGFVQFADHQFESEPVRTNLVNRSISSVKDGSLNMAREDLQDHYNASIGFSISQFVEDPSSFYYGGFRKLKVNQVRDSSNDISASMGHPYSRGDSNTISLGTNNDNSDENALSMGLFYINSENKEEENCISMCYNYSSRNGNTLPMGQSLLKGDANSVSVDQFSEKGDSNIMSLGSYDNKGQETFSSTGLPFNKVNESFILIGLSRDKGSNNVIAAAPMYDKADPNLTSMESAHEKGFHSLGQNYKNGEHNTLSFAGSQPETETDPSENIISGYNLSMAAHDSAQTAEEPRQMDSFESSVDPIVNSTPETNPKADIVSKNKVPETAKKTPANNFPSNVKSLLSTGMFDGVPVKYVSWTREKSLEGAIKGSRYQCGCSDCNYKKTLNAYEFERHAKCKTKHPNNHIYFGNGKTIYAIVQELKNTPQEKLFDAIQDMAGSLLNQKNFRIWKGNAASYQLATRELQRIYGKNEITLPS